MGKINRTALGELKRGMREIKRETMPYKQAENTYSKDISMNPAVRRMKIAFFGRNPEISYFLGSTKLFGKKVTFMSALSVSLVEIRNEKGDLTGIIKAERNNNKISIAGEVPSEIIKQFRDLKLEKEERYNPRELEFDKQRIINSINLGMLKDKRLILDK